MKSLTKPIVAALLAGLPFFTSQVVASPKPPASNIVNKNDKNSEGKESFSVSINQINNSDKVRLTIYQPVAKRLLVTLKDKDGATIHSFLTEKKENRVAKDYNFLDAEEGVYTLQVSDGTSTVRKQIKLEHVKVKEEAKISIE